MKPLPTTFTHLLSGCVCMQNISLTVSTPNTTSVLRACFPLFALSCIFILFSPLLAFSSKRFRHVRHLFTIDTSLTNMKDCANVRSCTTVNHVEPTFTTQLKNFGCCRFNSQTHGPIQVMKRSLLAALKETTVHTVSG